MLTASREKITANLAKFDSKEAFAKWLGRVLFLSYSSSDFEKEEEDLYKLFSWFDSMVETLAYVYEECIPDSKKLMFRQAIGEAMLEKENHRTGPIKVVEDLHYLMARVKATEVLPALVSSSCGFLGLCDEDLQYTGISCLASFAPSAEVYDTAISFLNSENFDDGYLFAIMKILNECNPSAAQVVIKSLKPRLIKLRDLAKRMGGKEWEAYLSCAKDFGATVKQNS